MLDILVCWIDYSFKIKVKERNCTCNFKVNLELFERCLVPHIARRAIVC